MISSKPPAVSQVAIYSHPWKEGGTLWNVLCGAYVAIFSAYWVANLVHLAAVDLRALADVRHFVNHKLGLSERQLQTVTWPEVVHRIVQARLVCPEPYATAAPYTWQAAPSRESRQSMFS